MARFYHFFGEPGDSVHCFQAAADLTRLAKTSLFPSCLKDPMSFQATYDFYATEYDWMVLTLATNRASPIPASKKITLLESISDKSPVRCVANVSLALLKRSDKPIEQNVDSLFSAFKTAELLRGQQVTAFLHNTSPPASIPASVPTRFTRHFEHLRWLTTPSLEILLAKAGELYFYYCRTGVEDELVRCCKLLQQISSEEFARLEVSIWECQHLEEYIETAVDIIDHLTRTLPNSSLAAYPEALLKAWESRRQGKFSPPMKWPDQ
jgi:hypothetical protein